MSVEFENVNWKLKSLQSCLQWLWHILWTPSESLGMQLSGLIKLIASLLEVNNKDLTCILCKYLTTVVPNQVVVGEVHNSKFM